MSNSQSPNSHTPLHPELEGAIQRVTLKLKETNQDTFLVAHLARELLEAPSIITIFNTLKVDIYALAKSLDDLISQLDPSDQPISEITYSQEFRRVLIRARHTSHSVGESSISPIQFFLSMYAEENSAASKRLYKFLDKNTLQRYLAHGISPNETSPSPAATADDSSSVEPNPLEAFTHNLNTRALNGKIDPLIGRETEVDRVIQILNRRRKNNPLLVGEAGVGKTAIAEGLAKRIAEGTVPESLKNTEILSLDLGALVAGTKYRGDFENRIKIVVKELASRPNIILFIDEIHTLVGAGASGSGGTMDASNLLKPALSSGELRCIGATTRQEYRSIFEKESALSRRFQKIDVDPPSIENTIQIITGLKEQYESHHGVIYSPEAIQAAVKLSERYITDRHLPDKAIDVIDEAGAKMKSLKTEAGSEPTAIDVSHIEAVVAQIAKVPVKSVSQKESQKLRTLDRDIKQVVFGQDKAIDSLADSIHMNNAGLRDPKQPLAKFLFTGPSGVGKTEVAKQMADKLGIPLVRYDMSEYMEPHSVSRLIGAPPGYTGHEAGGQLIEDIKAKPHCVLLLDEIEKAHPDILKAFLQVFEEGQLKDGQGRVGDFKNCLIIMTSNVGAARAANKNPLGFSQTVTEAKSEVVEADLKSFFPPEFRNRLDAIIPFSPITPEILQSIVFKELSALETKLLERDKPIKIKYTDDVIDYLKKNGYDPTLGARPLKRLIADKMTKPLAKEISIGLLEDGGEVEFSISHDKGSPFILFEVTSAHQMAAKPKKRKAALTA